MPRKREDLTGQRFGKLLAIRMLRNDEIGNRSSKNVYWLFKCDCGKFLTRMGCSIKHRSKKGETPSCKGCSTKRGSGGRPLEDITGKKFGHLTGVRVLTLQETKNLDRGRKRTWWLFKCDCGNFVSRRIGNVKIAESLNMKSKCRTCNVKAMIESKKKRRGAFLRAFGRNFGTSVRIG